MITAVQAQDLALDRGGRRLFEGLSFDLRAREALALTGPNGAGKTSLLRALAGLLRPSEGEVRFAGPDSALDATTARAAGLHWLGSHDGLKGSRSAEAELAFWSEWMGPCSQPVIPEARSAVRDPGVAGNELGRGAPAVIGQLTTDRSRGPRVPDSRVASSGMTERVEAALQTLGLADHARTEVSRLSTGQRRRLALARLFASSRPLWLLDEPLAPLDAAWRAKVGQLMRAHLDGGGLIIAAVHDPLPVPARELRLEAAA